MRHGVTVLVAALFAAAAAASHSVQAEDYVYFLIDKSGSMGEIDEKQQTSYLDLAKQRVVEAFAARAHQERTGRVQIILFDSALRESYRQEVPDAEVLRRSLAGISPGGNTCIGARLEEVRREIEAARPRTVELHLLSDLQENRVEGVSLEQAIRNMNVFLNLNRNTIAAKVFAYTWSKNPSEAVSEQLAELTAPDKEVVPLATPLARAVFEATPVFHMDLTEENGRYVAVQPARVRIDGYVDPRLLQRGARLQVKAAVLLGGNQHDVTLDGLDELDLSALADRQTGRFDKREVAVKIRDAGPFLAAGGPALLREELEVVFSPVLAPQPADLTVAAPATVRCKCRFFSGPQIYLPDFAGGRKLFRDHVINGESMEELVEIAWNTAAQGSKLAYTARIPPGAGLRVRICGVDGRDLSLPVTLDETHRLQAILRFENAATCDGRVVFELARQQEARVELPFSLACQPPAVSITLGADMAPGGGPATVPVAKAADRSFAGAIVLEPVVAGRPFQVSLQLAGTPGLVVQFTDPADRTFRIESGGDPVVLNVPELRALGCTMQASVAGNYEATLICLAKSPSLVLVFGPSRDKLIRIPLSVRAARLRLEWLLAKGELQLGATPQQPLALDTRGQDVTTNDPALTAAGFRLVASVVPEDCAQGVMQRLAAAGAQLRVVAQSDAAEGENRFVSAVFACTGAPTCQLSQFLEQPHFVLKSDPKKRHWLYNRLDSGRLLLTLVAGAENKEADLIDLPTLHYRVRLSP